MHEKNGWVFLGGGGHCKVIIDTLQESGYNGDVYILDNDKLKGDNILGYPIIGDDSFLSEVSACFGFVSLGGIGKGLLRERLFHLLLDNKLMLPNIIAPSAIISKYAKIGKNVFVGRNAVINAGAIIGDGAIINTSAIVEHDACVGAFVHVAPGAVISGAVQIGDYSHIGAGACVKQGITIGTNCLIGMGSVVTKNIKSNIKAFGVPCKVVSEL